MRTSRIYQAIELAEQTEVTLDRAASHYIVNVLRLGPNTPIILFNGKGGQYQGEIIQADKKKSLIAIQQFQAIEVESPLVIHLGQGISRGEKMDFTIQKAVELGVKEITPLFSERCGVKLSSDRIEKRMQHWQSVIISACEQCGRNQIPMLHQAMNYQDWLTQEVNDLRFILDPRAEKGLTDYQQTPEKVRLAIGPEGGFSDQEVNAAITAVFNPLLLGQRILRTETAALSAITAMQCYWGDFK